MNYQQYEVIEWLDHCTYDKSEWRSEEEVGKLEPIKVITLGFLVKETKESVILASTGTIDGHLGQEFLILKRGIVRRQKVKSPWKAWK